MTKLALLNVEKYLPIYNNMVKAIGVCFDVDECKDIVNKSHAVAAYYKQIKDDDTVQKFNRVKLRAWRRIAELFRSIDCVGCGTQREKIDKIRAAFEEVAVAEMPDSRIYQLLQLGELSDADFEYAILQEVNGSIPDLLRRTPEQEAILKSRAEIVTSAEPTRPPTPQEIEKEKKRKAKDALINKEIQEAADASFAAIKEVGITLEVKHRLEMKSVVFLIKDEVHAVLRQAAFDQNITMQEVLRRGLRMWLIAHDYDFPDNRKPTTSPSRGSANSSPVMAAAR